MNMSILLRWFNPLSNTDVTRNKALVEEKKRPKQTKRGRDWGSSWTHQRLPAHSVEQEPGRSSTSGALSAKFVRPGFPSRSDGALFHWRPRKPSVPLRNRLNTEATETAKGARDILVNLWRQSSEETKFSLGCHVEGSGYLLRTLRVRTQQERVESAANRYGPEQVDLGLI